MAVFGLAGGFASRLISKNTAVSMKQLQKIMLLKIGI
jgi:hypothetical protein